MINVIPDCPAVRQWGVEVDEILLAPREAAADIVFRDVVTAFDHSLGDALDREFGGRDPQIMEFELVAETLCPVDHPLVRFSTEGALEGEGDFPWQEFVDFSEKEFSCSENHAGRIEGRETAGEFVSVEESRDGIELLEIGLGEGGFARSVGSCEEVENGSGHLILRGARVQDSDSGMRRVGPDPEASIPTPGAASQTLRRSLQS